MMHFEQTETHLTILVPELQIDLQGPGPFKIVRTNDNEQSFQDNVLHGASRWFTPTGQLLGEHWFWKGLQVGIGREYYASGALYRVERFRSGLKQGVQEAYYEQGALKTKEVYIEGLLHGEALLYWPSGQLKRRAQFAQGKKIADEIWDEDGHADR
jgi:antitoxin component YwqK of YwqJK toxin-antitoxin module